MPMYEMMLAKENPCFSSMPPQATMGQAVKTMLSQNKSAVTVMEGGLLKGIVTRTDVLRLLDPTANNVLDKLQLSKIMTKELVVAGPEKSFHHALERMAQSNIEHLPVIQDGRLLTVVHESDLLRHQLDALNTDINHLQEYIDGLHKAEQD